MRSGVRPIASGQKRWLCDSDRPRAERECAGFTSRCKNAEDMPGAEIIVYQVDLAAPPDTPVTQMKIRGEMMT